MNAETYRLASLAEKEMFTLLLKLQEDVNYIKSIVRRIEKELSDEDETLPVSIPQAIPVVK